MVKETSDILELVLKIFGIIGGLVAAYLFIKKWHKSYVEKKSRFFSGNWSNEGNIGGEEATHYLDLKLTCSGDELDGSFNVRKNDENHTWYAVGISGKRFFSTAKCKIIHIRHGQVLNYGIVVLRKDSKRNLKWVLKEGVADFFPKETTLYRSLPALI
ncbi:hypothetical protein [Terrimonas alba]|uniref:hypothetical protein n=1 Tax=Terrimonas alba TaxID=3349636 RepID=UPI0035F23FD4